jgi:wyosine [tRNA(Phe)-imidazoG37] synthetase (radical SAM superfamily)
MNHVFGPVPSRRLGISLGIDPIPRKVCSFDCVYCEVARTSIRTLKRKEYFPTTEIMQDLKDWFTSSDVEPDYVTFSGSGEPTLHSGIGEMIAQIKEITNSKVAVITNGSTLFMPEVRNDLHAADVVMPSLDTVIATTFRKINRPHPEVTIEKILDGLQRFRSEYTGQLWLEILIVKNINDKLTEYQALAEAVQTFQPDRIQLNTISRPAGTGARIQPVARRELIKLQTLLGDKAESIASFKGHAKAKNNEQIAQAVYELLKIRACTIQGMSGSIGISAVELQAHINRFIKNGRIQAITFQGETYYKIPTENEIKTK